MEHEEMFVILLDLNAKFQPEDRQELADALNTVFARLEIGETDGSGGTLVDNNGEIEGCDIDLYIHKKRFEDDIERAMNAVAKIVDKLGVPKRSLQNL